MGRCWRGGFGEGGVGCGQRCGEGGGGVGGEDRVEEALASFGASEFGGVTKK